MLTRSDHVMVCVPDLQHRIDAYRRQDVRRDPRGWAPNSSLDFSAHSLKVTANSPGWSRFTHRVVGIVSLTWWFFWVRRKRPPKSRGGCHA